MGKKAALAAHEHTPQGELLDNYLRRGAIFFDFFRIKRERTVIATTNGQRSSSVDYPMDGSNLIYYQHPNNGKGFAFEVEKLWTIRWWIPEDIEIVNPTEELNESAYFTSCLLEYHDDEYTTIDKVYTANSQQITQHRTVIVNDADLTSTSFFCDDVSFMIVRPTGMEHLGILDDEDSCSEITPDTLLYRNQYLPPNTSMHLYLVWIRHFNKLSSSQSINVYVKNNDFNTITLTRDLVSQMCVPQPLPIKPISQYDTKTRYINIYLNPFVYNDSEIPTEDYVLIISGNKSYSVGETVNFGGESKYRFDYGTNLTNGVSVKIQYEGKTINRYNYEIDGQHTYFWNNNYIFKNGYTY